MTAKAVVSSISRTMAGIDLRPASFAARNLRSPARISYIPFSSGWGSTTIGCRTPSSRIEPARERTDSLVIDLRRFSLVETSLSSGMSWVTVLVTGFGPASYVAVVFAFAMVASSIWK